MNTRQKAKHFKKLYEQSLAQKPATIIIKTKTPKCYTAQILLDVVQCSKLENELPNVFHAHIENLILDQIKPLVWSNLKSEIDVYTGKRRFWMRFWLEGGNNDNQG